MAPGDFTGTLGAAVVPALVSDPLGFFFSAANSAFMCARLWAGARLIAFAAARSPTRVLWAL